MAPDGAGEGKYGWKAKENCLHQGYALTTSDIVVREGWSKETEVVANLEKQTLVFVLNFENNRAFICAPGQITGWCTIFLESKQRNLLKMERNQEKAKALFEAKDSEDITMYERDFIDYDENFCFSHSEIVKINNKRQGVVKSRDYRNVFHAMKNKVDKSREKRKWKLNSTSYKRNLLQLPNANDEPLEYIGSTKYLCSLEKSANILPEKLRPVVGQYAYTTSDICVQRGYSTNYEFITITKLPTHTPVFISEIKGNRARIIVIPWTTNLYDWNWNSYSERSSLYGGKDCYQYGIPECWCTLYSEKEKRYLLQRQKKGRYYDTYVEEVKYEKKEAEIYCDCICMPDWSSYWDRYYYLRYWDRYYYLKEYGDPHYVELLDYVEKIECSRNQKNFTPKKIRMEKRKKKGKRKRKTNWKKQKVVLEKKKKEKKKSKLIAEKRKLKMQRCRSDIQILTEKNDCKIDEDRLPKQSQYILYNCGNVGSYNLKIGEKWISNTNIDISKFFKVSGIMKSLMNNILKAVINLKPIQKKAIRGVKNLKHQENMDTKIAAAYAQQQFCQKTENIELIQKIDKEHEMIWKLFSNFLDSNYDHETIFEDLLKSIQQYNNYVLSSKVEKFVSEEMMQEYKESVWEEKLICLETEIKVYKDRDMMSPKIGILKKNTILQLIMSQNPTLLRYSPNGEPLYAKIESDMYYEYSSIFNACEQFSNQNSENVFCDIYEPKIGDHIRVKDDIVYSYRGSEGLMGPKDIIYVTNIQDDGSIDFFSCSSTGHQIQGYIKEDYFHKIEKLNNIYVPIIGDYIHVHSNIYAHDNELLLNAGSIHYIEKIGEDGSIHFFEKIGEDGSIQTSQKCMEKKWFHAIGKAQNVHIPTLTEGDYFRWKSGKDIYHVKRIEEDGSIQTDSNIRIKPNLFRELEKFQVDWIKSDHYYEIKSSLWAYNCKDGAAVKIDRGIVYVKGFRDYRSIEIFELQTEMKSTYGECAEMLYIDITDFDKLKVPTLSRWHSASKCWNSHFRYIPSIGDEVQVQSLKFHSGYFSGYFIGSSWGRTESFTIVNVYDDGTVFEVFRHWGDFPTLYFNRSMILLLKEVYTKFNPSMNIIPSVYVPSAGDYIEVMSNFEVTIRGLYGRTRTSTLHQNQILYVSKIKNNGSIQIMDIEKKSSSTKYIITSEDFHKIRKAIKDVRRFTGQLLSRTRAAELNCKVGYYVQKELNWMDGQRIFEVITSYLTSENFYNNPRIGDQVQLVKRMTLYSACGEKAIHLLQGTNFEIEELNADGSMKVSYDLQNVHKNLAFPTHYKYTRYCRNPNVKNLEITNVSMDGQITALLTSKKYVEWSRTMCYYLE